MNDFPDQIPPSYKIPVNDVFYEESIKRSKFIVNITHTPDLEAAKAFLVKIKTKYPDAGHHCWAHVAGVPGGSHILGFSDDGEPNGTAGKPMLNVLMGSGVGEITAVVTRYFGGIKLGTGGLVRAYGGSLNHAMEALKTTEKIPEAIIEGQSGYGHQTIIEQVLKSYKILNIEKSYEENVYWNIKVDARQAEKVIAEITDRTGGRVNFHLRN
jgi:uncharacterized YigZ family protein